MRLKWTRQRYRVAVKILEMAALMPWCAPEATSFTLRGSRRAASEESFLDAGTAARSLPSRQRARVLARSLALARFTTWLAGRSAPKLWPGMIWRPWR